MPAAARSDDCIGSFRTPGVSPVRANAVVGFEDRIDHRPSGFHRVFPREQGTIASHGVAQESLVRSFLTRPFF
jgi:hypothetical protein